MLTNIENRLEELFEHIEMMPTEKVELAEKVHPCQQLQAEASGFASGFSFSFGLPSFTNMF